MSSGQMPPLHTTANTGERAENGSTAHERKVDRRVNRIADLLHSLGDAAAEGGLFPSRPPSEAEQWLVDARLGVASSLFTALRCKHGPTAHHCLRVALGCSAWATALEVPQAYRVALEVAALLHDVGKIGVPDSILLKPGKLSADEAEIMAHHRQRGVEILSSCCTTPEVLEIVRYATAWYDGSRHDLECTGNESPLGARMLAIVDAFDSMITDHVYRPARSRERALADLFAGAPAQFDPKLVRSFHDVFSGDADSLLKNASNHWLSAVAGYTGDVTWGLATPHFTADGTEEVRHFFEARFIDKMHDGVVFVDRDLQIFLWNSGAERLTGLAAAATSGRRWVPALLDMRSDKGRQIPDVECPVALAIQSGVQSLSRMSIVGRSGRDLAINLHAVPVQRSDGGMLGATVFLQDASPEASLEQRCQTLQDQATRDPLTRLANRAEFDRLHKLFIDVHTESGLAFSMIISDIDHFKHVNDVYGHQAGDDALRSYAALLRGMCRSGDVVARYGGEEFVILCADCNNASAAERAEQIRRRLAEVPQPALNNRGITASFGVTELQPGDTPETMLRRADRALLQAKDQGRNQVVQLGSGMVETEKRRRWWPFRTSRSRSLIDCRLVTIVPLDVAVEKLRGFIADHSAKITVTGDDHLTLEVSGEKAGAFRRGDDRPVPFVLEIQFLEERVERTNAQGLAGGDYVQTVAHVVIRPKRDRDRRRDQAAERARHLLLSMKSYLMAKEQSAAGNSPPQSAPAADVADGES